MNLRDLRPASEFAQIFGCKAIVYGPPGGGKTPIINTAPRPLLLACEPGLLSMRNSKVPTFLAPTADKIDEFFDWLFGSNEAQNFDTIAIDSASEMCETYLRDLQEGKSKGGNKMHGLQAYGEMAKKFLKHIDMLYYAKQKHTYIVAKQEIITAIQGPYKRPYYPGQQLPVAMPHKFDCILHLDVQNVPGRGQVQAFRCIGSIDTMARNRTGTLAEFEPPDFSYIVGKVMS